VPALLRKAAVIDEQCFRAARPRHHLLEHVVTHRREHRVVGPRRVGHEMMQALMLRAHPRWRQMRRHRLNALALCREQQPVQ